MLAGHGRSDAAAGKEPSTHAPTHLHTRTRSRTHTQRGPHGRAESRSGQCGLQSRQPRIEGVRWRARAGRRWRLRAQKERLQGRNGMRSESRDMGDGTRICTPEAPEPRRRHVYRSQQLSTLLARPKLLAHPPAHPPARTPTLGWLHLQIDGGPAAASVWSSGRGAVEQRLQPRSRSSDACGRAGVLTPLIRLRATLSASQWRPGAAVED